MENYQVHSRVGLADEMAKSDTFKHLLRKKVHRKFKSAAAKDKYITQDMLLSAEMAMPGERLLTTEGEQNMTRLGSMINFMNASLVSRDLKLSDFTHGFFKSVKDQESTIMRNLINFTKHKIPQAEYLTKRWNDLDWEHILKRYSGEPLHAFDYVALCLGSVVTIPIKKMTFIYTYLGRCHVISTFDKDKRIDEYFVLPYVYEECLELIQKLYKIQLSLTDINKNDQSGIIMFNYIKNVYLNRVPGENKLGFSMAESTLSFISSIVPI